MLPTVAIVGRPNVGKSTLFNRLVGKKLALVDDSPGVTRDRREGDGHLMDLSFRVIDTAGYEDEDPQTLPGRMRRQTEAAVAEAQAVLFMIDGRAGLTPLDEEIARWLRGSDKPAILLVNKAEGREAEPGLLESFRLGLGEPVAISAEHGEGMADLFQALAPHLDAYAEAATDIMPVVEIDTGEGAEDAEDELRPDAPLALAIVGRPNAGKSTLINTMLGHNRLITGPEAGITRDSIAIDWAWADPRAGAPDEPRAIRLIDTAGMRKKARVQDKLEKLSVADARRAVDFAEVVVLLLDATRGLEAQDLRIADHVLAEGRALIVAINKWDIAENPSALFAGIRGALSDGLAQVRDVPLVAVSAMTGKGIDEMLAAAFDIREAWSRRVPTGELNRWLEHAIAANPPPAPKGKRIKLRYITQAKTRPPSFVLFGTRISELPESYRRYLLNAMRRDLGFGPIPVRLTIRAGKNPYAGR